MDTGTVSGSCRKQGAVGKNYHSCKNFNINAICYPQMVDSPTHSRKTYSFCAILLTKNKVTSSHVSV